MGMKLNKKIKILSLTFALIGVFLFYFFFFLGGGKIGMTGFASTSLTFLDDGMVISNETCEKLNRVIVIHKTGCIECNKVMPILKEIEKENDLSFTYYDILLPEDKNELISELNLIPRKAPTVIVDCKVYVGPRSELEYKNYILG
jgi:thiol-disulfide isomerase/thioredoxin